MKLLLIFLLSFSCFAQDIVPIKKGQVAPIDGYIITRAAHNKIKAKMETLQYENLKLHDLAIAQDEAIVHLKRHKATLAEHNASLRTELRRKPTGFWQKTGYFVMGAVLTGVVSYGAIRSVR